jgi:hypothetical protein
LTGCPGGMGGVVAGALCGMGEAGVFAGEAEDLGF